MRKIQKYVATAMVMTTLVATTTAATGCHEQTKSARMAAMGDPASVAREGDTALAQPGANATATGQEDEAWLTGSAPITSAADNPSVSTQAGDSQTANAQAATTQTAQDGAAPGHLLPAETIAELVQADIRNGFPSAQLAILHGTELEYSNAWGAVRVYNKYGVPIPVNQRTPASTQTLYDIAGTSVPFAAQFAMLKIISNPSQAGASQHVSFDTRVVDVLGEGFVRETLDWRKIVNPDAPSVDQMKQWKEQITIGDLLLGQSGLPVGVDLHKATITAGNTGEMVANPLFNETRERAASRRLIMRAPCLYEPGTECRMTDTDAVLLTFIVEELTGMRLDNYLTKLWNELPTWARPDVATFNPLQNGYHIGACAATEISGNTRYGLVDFPLARRDVVQGAVHDETAYYAMAGVSGNAGLFINAESLAKLARLYLPSSGYFSSEVYERIFQYAPHSDYTGMGWYIEKDATGADEEYWLNGFTRCYIGILPQEDRVVAYLTNAIHSPVGWSNNDFSEHDLAHARFLCATYKAAGQGMLYGY